MFINNFGCGCKRSGEAVHGQSHMWTGDSSFSTITSSSGTLDGPRGGPGTPTTAARRSSPRVYTDARQALETVSEAAFSRAIPLSPIDGFAVSIKDLFDGPGGEPTMAGCRGVGLVRRRAKADGPGGANGCVRPGAGDRRQEPT